MKPNLYICHTAYQVLVDLLRASRTDGQPHTMVLSAAVPEPQSLAKKLEATGAVKVVIVDETRWPGTVTGPFAARRARRTFEKLCGWRFTRAAYNEVRIASTLIEASPDLSDVLIFEGGEAVRIPIVETVETPETLPPWRR